MFRLGCLFCGLARDMSQLITARAFAGRGGGGMTTVVSILLSDVVPLRERGQWQGYVKIVYAASRGSVRCTPGRYNRRRHRLEGFVSRSGTIVHSSLWLRLSALHLPKQIDLDWRKKLGRVDFLGAAVLFAAIFTFLLTFDRRSNTS